MVDYIGVATLIGVAVFMVISVFFGSGIGTDSRPPQRRRPGPPRNRPPKPPRNRPSKNSKKILVKKNGKSKLYHVNCYGEIFED